MEPLELLHLNGRKVRFWRDDAKYVLEEHSRRLSVSITEEEYKEFAGKGLRVHEPTPWDQVPKDTFILRVRIPSGMVFTMPSGNVDLIVVLRTWQVRDKRGTIAYLQSCVPTKT